MADSLPSQLKSLKPLRTSAGFKAEGSRFDVTREERSKAVVSSPWLSKVQEDLTPDAFSSFENMLMAMLSSPVADEVSHQSSFELTSPKGSPSPNSTTLPCDAAPIPDTWWRGIDWLPESAVINDAKQLASAQGSPEARRTAPVSAPSSTGLGPCKQPCLCSHNPSCHSKQPAVRSTLSFALPIVKSPGSMDLHSNTGASSMTLSPALIQTCDSGTESGAALSDTYAVLFGNKDRSCPYPSGTAPTNGENVSTTDYSFFSAELSAPVSSGGTLAQVNSSGSCNSYMDSKESLLFMDVFDYDLCITPSMDAAMMNEMANVWQDNEQETDVTSTRTATAPPLPSAPSPTVLSARVLQAHGVTSEGISSAVTCSSSPVVYKGQVQMACDLRGSPNSLLSEDPSMMLHGGATQPKRLQRLTPSRQKPAGGSSCFKSTSGAAGRGAVASRRRWGAAQLHPQQAEIDALVATCARPTSRRGTALSAQSEMSALADTSESVDDSRMSKSLTQSPQGFKAISNPPSSVCTSSAGGVRCAVPRRLSGGILTATIRHNVYLSQIAAAAAAGATGEFPPPAVADVEPSVEQQPKRRRHTTPPALDMEDVGTSALTTAMPVTSGDGGRELPAAGRVSTADNTSVVALQSLSSSANSLATKAVTSMGSASHAMTVPGGSKMSLPTALHHAPIMASDLVSPFAADVTTVVGKVSSSSCGLADEGTSGPTRRSISGGLTVGARAGQTVGAASSRARSQTLGVTRGVVAGILAEARSLTGRGPLLLRPEAVLEAAAVTGTVAALMGADGGRINQLLHHTCDTASDGYAAKDPIPSQQLSRMTGSGTAAADADAAHAVAVAAVAAVASVTSNSGASPMICDISGSADGAATGGGVATFAGGGAQTRSLNDDLLAALSAFNAADQEDMDLWTGI